MARKRFGISLLLAVTVLVASAVAQQSNEVSFSLGRSFISDQAVSGTGLANPNIHFGQGLTYVANYGHRFFNFGIASSPWRSRLFTILKPSCNLGRTLCPRISAPTSSLPQPA